MKILSLHKSRTILQVAYSWYKKRNAQLAPQELASLEQQMLALESAIAAGNREAASPLAESLEQYTQAHCKKSLFDYLKEIIIAIVIALLLAVVVRQMWFELYEIPTGSMRPTFREQDRVAVSKTPFGINMPMSTGHFMFDPSLVVRGGAITFTSEGIDKLDEDTTFMWVIPYKKRLIKRMIGKPGDSLYFYGGKIYGVSKDGKPINELLDAPWMHSRNFDLEHIPIIRFSKERYSADQKEVQFLQMNIPIGRILLQGNELLGQIFDGKSWIKEDPLAQRTEHSSLKAYSDFFGMRNFAMARLLTAKEVQEIDGINPKELPEGVLYLELSHHPGIVYPPPSIRQNSRNPLVLSTLKTVIPLKQSHLDKLMDHMYTARLVFKGGRATRYSTEHPYFDAESPVFKDVPDGTYEFYEGKLQQVGRGAIIYAADSKNPLYSHDPKNVQKLFNLGIDMHNAYMPTPGNLGNLPARYAYFRDGDLYLLGAPILQKGDPALDAFIAREAKRETSSSKSRPYTAFKDYGPPLKDGKFDVNFIRTFGVTLPDKQYLVLGDNHAMSGDSRDFGFVPEANLQGAPSLILWPPGERLGFPWQAPYALFVLPRMIVWALVGTIALIWYYFHRRYLRRPIILVHHNGAKTSNT